MPGTSASYSKVDFQHNRQRVEESRNATMSENNRPEEYNVDPRDSMPQTPAPDGHQAGEQHAQGGHASASQPNEYYAGAGAYDPAYAPGAQYAPDSGYTHGYVPGTQPPPGAQGAPEPQGIPSGSTAPGWQGMPGGSGVPNGQAMPYPGYYQPREPRYEPYPPQGKKGMSNGAKITLATIAALIVLIITAAFAGLVGLFFGMHAYDYHPAMHGFDRMIDPEWNDGSDFSDLP